MLFERLLRQNTVINKGYYTLETKYKQLHLVLKVRLFYDKQRLIVY